MAATVPEAMGGHPLTHVGAQHHLSSSMCRCWGDTGSTYGCQRPATTAVGLCDDHYEEIVGGLA